MRLPLGSIAFVLTLLCLSASIAAGENMTDPYRILEKHYQAIGGLERLIAQKTVYEEGTITIVDAGLKGTFKQWSEKPLRMRQEVDLGVITSITGDNGKFSWMVDHNGKIQVQKDESTLKDRELEKLIEVYDHLDPLSKNFTLIFENIEKINDEDCYVVRMTNKINTDIQIDYYRVSDFYLVKTVLIKPDIEQHTEYSDFRSIDGVIQPFHKIVEVLPTGEKQVLDYGKYEFNMEISAACFEPPHEDIRDFQFTNGENAENVHYEFIEDHIFLPVNINGQEKLWVLDCGASVNVIDSSYALELGLKLEGSIKGQANAGVMNFYFATLPAYRVGGIQFSEQKVVAISIRDLLQRAMGMEVVGILGYDFLSRFITKIDYANERISFYDPNKFAYQGQGKIIEAHLDDEHMFSLPITVDKKYSGKWRLDIGATGLDFHYPYAQTHDMLERPGIDAIAAGAAGEYEVRLSEFQTIDLAGFTIANPIIGIPHQESKGTFSEKSLVGNIGNTFLQNFVLYLDYKNQRVIVEKGDNYNRKFPRPKSGLQLMYNETHDIEVNFVAPHTPADEVGFEKGDIIKKINGIGVNYFDGIIAIRNLFEEETGTRYTFEVLRDKELKVMEITLRELF